MTSEPEAHSPAQAPTPTLPRLRGREGPAPAAENGRVTARESETGASEPSDRVLGDLAIPGSGNPETGIPNLELGIWNLESRVRHELEDQEV